TNAITMALDKSELSIDVDKGRQSLIASKQQLIKLKQQNVESLINQSNLNGAINNANIWINGNDFIKMWNGKKNITASKGQNREKKEKQREEQILKERLLESRIAPRVQDYNDNYDGPDEN